MRIRHFLLLGGFIATGPCVAADPKPALDKAATPKTEAVSPTRGNSAWSLMASDQLQNRPSGKNRVRYTFPPSTKRM